MRIMTLWFSFKGRASRADLWLRYLLPLFAAFYPVKFMLSGPQGQGISPILGIPIFVLFLWTQFAVYTKRLHDRDHPGWYIILGGIPIVQIWIWIEIFLLSGNLGDNTFGPPQMAPADEGANSW